MSKVRAGCGVISRAVDSFLWTEQARSFSRQHFLQYPDEHTDEAPPLHNLPFRIPEQGRNSLFTFCKASRTGGFDPKGSVNALF
jgi:hypothetical protein